MFEGTQQFVLDKVTVFTIKADAPFKVYGVVGGEKVSYIAPNRPGELFTKFVVVPPIEEVLVETDDKTLFTCEQKVINAKESPDPTPIEIPLEMTRPLSLKEEMQRFIKQELSNQASVQDFGTFDEEEDFDIPDENDYIIESKYEMDDLIEYDQPYAVDPPADKDAQDAQPKDMDSLPTPEVAETEVSQPTS